ncbi:hypothetical protein E3Q06_00403 [Wallemia mellicola]|nr:hypothetical protein E3Q21_00226 [Wallemia mellicola]TIB92075.1 hypothetical protein E3Q20_00453 [Wallemia mellicola]TIC43728.1 hypothetical protein E3Q07_00403 [Wallemia mellicola]TIC52859.1 hypothetical protein E3Q06_00403 [Wallemia mellicola]
MQESAVDDEDVCRICRCSSEDDRTLYHPCRCSGSLKFVHQDCLREWLNVTKKQHCEICKHPFGFTKVYSPSMPIEIPRFLFFKRALICVGKWFTQALHFLLVAFVWLGMLPYVTIWCWRWYFYFGNTIISTIKLAQREVNVTLENTQQSPTNSTSLPSTGENTSEQSLLKSILWTIINDIFQGQTITCSLVVIFVVIFLLREWVIQQGPINDPTRQIDNSRPPPPLRQLLDEQQTQLPTPQNLEVPLNERLKRKKKARQLLNPLQIPNSAAAFNISDNSSQTSETTTSSVQIKQRRISDIIKEDHLANDVNVAANLPLPESPAVAVGSTSAIELPSAVSRASSLRSNTAANRTNAWVTNSDNKDYLSPNTAFNSSAIDDDIDEGNWDDKLSTITNVPSTSAMTFDSSDNNQEDFNHRELDHYFNPDETDEHQNIEDDRRSEQTQIAEDDNANEEGEAGEIDGGIMDDELDGLFEAVGLRGPVANLFQNSALMVVLFFVGIGCFIFLPYTIGKIFAQLRPIDIPLLPIQITRWFTDPIFDFVALIFSKLFFPSSRTIGIHELTKLPMHIRAQNAIAQSFANAENWAASQESQSWASIKGPFLKLLKGLLSFFHALFATTSQKESIEDKSNFIEKAYNVLSKVPILRNHLDSLNVASGIYTGFVEWVKRKSWSLALNDGTSERVVSILLGYTVITTVAAIYLNTQSTVLQVAHVVKDAMAQQVILAKIAVLFASELVLFPLACGILLEFCSLPLYQEINIQARIDYTLNSPVTSLFTKWLCGTLLLFLVSVLITGIRKLLRPGVLWFIRDPNDPNFAPMRDVLERSAWTHVRKLAFSAFLYSTFILSTFGVGFCMLRFGFNGILPFRWKAQEPISVVPVDLLFLQFVMPFTIRKLGPKDLAKSFYAKWWKWASSQLGLSSFMFGGRYKREETRYRVYNWKTMFGFKQRKRDMRFGNWMRVPATDNVSFDRRRPCPMLVPVDDNGYPIDTRGEKAVANQLREASFNARDPAKDWCVVYAPPNFKRRLLWFIAYLWATTVIAAIGIVVPSITIGRLIMDNWAGREMHDLYCLIIGLYAVLVPPIMYKKYVKNITYNQVVRLMKSLYFISALGFIFPTFLGITLELSIIIPNKYIINNLQFPPRLNIPQAWCLGLLSSRFFLYFAKSRDINEPINLIHKLQTDGFDSITVRQFNSRILKPISQVFLIVYIFPTVVANYSSKLISESIINSAYIQLDIFAFPLTIAFLSSFILRDKIISVVKRLDVIVRDEEFLLERQLQNAE